MPKRKTIIKSSKNFPGNQSPVCFLESDEVQDAYKYPDPQKKIKKPKKDR